MAHLLGIRCQGFDKSKGEPDLSGFLFLYCCADILCNGSTYYTRDPNGNLISERTSSGTYYYLTDKLGSVRVVTDSSGNVQNTYSYDPLGNSVSKTENVANPWQFAGGYHDASTGLYKFGTRYYSPQIDRWTQQDPAGIKPGDLTSLNRYVYSDDDSVNMTDPGGKSSKAGPLACAAAVVFGFYSFDWVGGLTLSAFFTMSLAAFGSTALGNFFGPLLGTAAALAGVAITMEEAILIYNTIVAPICGTAPLDWVN